MYRIIALIISLVSGLRLRTTPDSERITANIPIEPISAEDSSIIESTPVPPAPNYLPDPQVGAGITYTQNSTLVEGELVPKIVEEDVTFCDYMKGPSAILAGCKDRPTS